MDIYPALRNLLLEKITETAITMKQLKKVLAWFTKRKQNSKKRSLKVATNPKCEAHFADDAVPTEDGAQANVLTGMTESIRAAQSTQNPKHIEEVSADAFARTEANGSENNNDSGAQSVGSVNQSPATHPIEATYSERGPQVVITNYGTADCVALLLSADLINQLGVNLELSRKISVLGAQI